MKAVTIALAAFFTLVQFYTCLAALSPTPPVGYLFASRAGAAALAAALVLAAAVLSVRLVRERRAPPAASRAIVTVWIGSALLSAVFGLDPGLGLQVVGMMALTGLFHLALVRFYARPGVAASVVTTYLATGLAASVAALAMAATRRPGALWALNHGRAAGVFVTANQFAAFLIAFVFIAAGTALANGAGLRRLGIAAAIAGSVALVATVSFAGLLGAGAAGAFYAFALGARRIALVAVVAIVAGTAILALRPAVRHDPAETFDRLRIWQAGIRVAELFPLTGVGPMAYYSAYPAIRPANGDPPGTYGALHPHDVYLSLAGETGIAGIAATIYGWSRFVRRFRIDARALDVRGRRFAYGVAAALVATLVQGLFDTIGVVEMAFVWLPFTALALAAARSGFPVGAEVAA